MKYIIQTLFSVFLFLSIHFAFAQKTGRIQSSRYLIDEKVSHSSFQATFIGKDISENTLREYLKSKIQNIQGKNVSLQLLHKIESPGGMHYTFEQWFNNIKIFRSQVKVNMDKNGNIKSVFDHTFEVTETLDDFNKLHSVFNSLPINELADDYKKEFIYFPVEKNLIPALRLEIIKGDNYFEIIYDGEGNIIYQRDIALYFHFQVPEDSIVNASIFLPDPLTTANVSYGVPYNDNNNTDVFELNAERKSVSLKVNYDTAATVFRLESPFVIITEHSSPVIPPITSTVPDFSITRSQSGFEDINAFYHISNFHSYIQSLGFGNLVNYQIPVDVHALNGQDNSNFIAFSNPPKLNFGEGGVDDAEDADVIIHEYGHAVSHSAAPFTNNGTERNALDEALGDYFASSYSRNINPFQWGNVFSWDGHNEFWNGRSSVSTDHYPENLQNDLYADADIWSSTMMEIWEDIGRENSDALQLQTIFGFGSGMSMKDAARLVIQADSALNNGAYYYQICDRFYNRGLIDICMTGIGKNIDPENSVQLLNTENFATGKGNAILRFNKPGEAIIQIFDVTGKLLFRKELKNENEFIIKGKGDELASGMYFLNVLSEKNSVNFKIAKH